MSKIRGFRLPHLRPVPPSQNPFDKGTARPRTFASPKLGWERAVGPRARWMSRPTCSMKRVLKLPKSEPKRKRTARASLGAPAVHHQHLANVLSGTCEHRAAG
eukprot:5885900-Prymnesium_polylepis.1